MLSSSLIRTKLVWRFVVADLTAATAAIARSGPIPIAIVAIVAVHAAVVVRAAKTAAFWPRRRLLNVNFNLKERILEQCYFFLHFKRGDLYPKLRFSVTYIHNNDNWWVVEPKLAAFFDMFFLCCCLNLAQLISILCKKPDIIWTCYVYMYIYIYVCIYIC